MLQANANGIGHVNIIPYYTVLGGFDTYLNLTNTDTRSGKLVKVRFRTAANADIVFDFTLALAPGDVWAAAVTLDAQTGLPRIVHADRSCTLPAGVQQVFSIARLSDSLVWTATRQAGSGHVEIITMADVPPVGSALFNAIRSTLAGTTPCTADVLATLGTDALSYAQAKSLGLDVPTTGLLTQWTLINVPRATSFTGLATALEARVANNGAAGYGNIVFSPQTATPIGDIAQIRQQTSDPLLRGGVADNTVATGPDLSAVAPNIVARYSDLPDLSTPYLPAALSVLGAGVATRLQAYAASRALAVRSLSNGYVLDADIAARTDWVVTMPTRRFNVATHPASANLQATNWSVDDSGNALGRGSFNYFHAANTGSNSPAACFNAFWNASGGPNRFDTALGRNTASVSADREGGIRYDMGIPDVLFDGPVHLCGATSLVRYALDSGSSQVDGNVGALGPAAPVLFPRVFPAAGWTRFETINFMPSGPSSGQGLPMIGFSAMELFNASATPGMAGAYGLTYPHAMTAAP